MALIAFAVQVQNAIIELWFHFSIGCEFLDLGFGKKCIFPPFQTNKHIRQASRHTDRHTQRHTHWDIDTGKGTGTGTVNVCNGSGTEAHRGTPTQTNWGRLIQTQAKRHHAGKHKLRHKTQITQNQFTGIHEYKTTLTMLTQTNSMRHTHKARLCATAGAGYSLPVLKQLWYQKISKA